MFWHSYSIIWFYDMPGMMHLVLACRAWGTHVQNLARLRQGHVSHSPSEDSPTFIDGALVLRWATVGKTLAELGFTLELLVPGGSPPP